MKTNRRTIAAAAAGISPAFAGTTPALASAGGGGHNPVTICHALGNGGYVMITPDATGVIKGHAGHQDGRDIIPAFEYTDKNGVVHSFPGQGDANVLANGCQAVELPPTYG